MTLPSPKYVDIKYVAVSQVQKAEYAATPSVLPRPHPGIGSTTCMSHVKPRGVLSGARTS
jgi:hypothetical protein